MITDEINACIMIIYKIYSTYLSLLNAISYLHSSIKMPPQKLFQNRHSLNAKSVIL